jgi:hypothetical protein
MRMHFRHQPGMAPMVFMNPNTDPASFGAKSWGFTMTALLWNPELAITHVEQKTANQKLRMSARKYIFFVKSFHIIILFPLRMIRSPNACVPRQIVSTIFLVFVIE